MLTERDSRMLSIAFDALMKDFEPRDAIPYMCSKQIISEDQQEAILRMPSHILRVSEFIRQYRRFADDLSPLISYFEKYGQPHLAEILSKSYVHEERPLLTDRQINFRLSVEGNVPHRLYNYVERRELIRDLEEVLIRLASLDRFWLVVHGFAGCGKSCLAAEVLRSCPALLSRFYEHVIWVRDGRTCVDELPALFSNFMVLASDAVVLTGKENTTQFLPLAKAALRDKPNALVILDDVYLSESVRWFDQLNCRILATSRNQEIFQVSSTNPIYFKIPSVGFTLAETACAINSVLAADNSPAYMEQVAWIHQKTAGLPALIGIVARLTNGRIESLLNLRNCLECQPIRALHCITNYWYTNIYDAIMESYSLLQKHQRTILETFVLFHENEWIPAELLSFCIEMDVSGEQDAMFVAIQELETLVKLSFLENWINQSPSAGRPVYDFRINPVMHAFLRCAVLKSDLEWRLHFIALRIRSYLSDNFHVESDFKQRILSYTDTHPNLFHEVPCKIYTEWWSTEAGAANSNSSPERVAALQSGDLKRNNKKRKNSWSDICIYMLNFILVKI